MLLDEVADLGAQANTMSSTVEDHSQQLGELLVTVQKVQEMMRTQQEQLMWLQMELWEWEQRLVDWEMVVNDHLNWLWSRVELMDVDEEEEDEEATMSMEVDEWSPVVLDSDLDDFGSPEPEPVPACRGVMGGQVN